MNLGAGELLLVLAIVALLLGPSKLPGLARSLGQAQREFRQALRERDTDPGPPSSPPADQGEGAGADRPSAPEQAAGT